MYFRPMIVMLGAAATLSFGLSQAAYAAPAAPARTAAATTAQAGSHTLSVLSPGTRSNSLTGRAVPRIQFRECAAQSTTWVKTIVVNIAAGTIDSWCFGFTGTWTFNPNNTFFSHFCAGNNHGSIRVIYNGTTRTYSFGAGTNIAWPALAHAESLTITGWSGSNRCS